MPFPRIDGRMWGRLGGVLCLLALLLFLKAPLIAGVHRLDREYFGETVTDTLSRWRGDEDWASAEPLLRRQDYRWLAAEAGHVRIAHALGESARAGANTLGAFNRAASRHFKLFEVDLWLDGALLRCHHGPPAPPPFKPGDCELGVLLEALPPDAWLILDLKTAFQPTGERLLEIASQRGRVDQLVFQLYKPEHLHQFNSWQHQYAQLPGPLVTAYLAHRSVAHVAAHVSRAGIQALTLPIERMPAYRPARPGLAVLVHPIHDCVARERALKAGARGLYQLADLSCPGEGR